MVGETVPARINADSRYFNLLSKGNFIFAPLFGALFSINFNQVAAEGSARAAVIDPQNAVPAQDRCRRPGFFNSKARFPGVNGFKIIGKRNRKFSGVEIIHHV